MALASRVDAPAASEHEIARGTRYRTAVRLLPFLFALFVTNFLDRSSVGYAALGMSRELGFTSQVIGFAASAFFVGYIPMQIPGPLLVERWSARWSIGIIMIAWGSLTALTALAQTPEQLYAARFALGVAEGGFFPGVVIYLSHWFISEDRAKATSSFFAAVPISLVIGSPIAGWVLTRQWLGLAGWRWLFVVEGVPALVLGVATVIYLTDRPRDAVWLQPEQRLWIEQTLARENATSHHSTSLIEAFLQTVRSRLVLLLAMSAFLEYFMGYSVIFFLPTMLKRLSGLSDQWVGLLGAVPYAVAAVAVVVLGWHSDRVRERRWHTAVPQFIAGAAWLGLLGEPRSAAVTIALFAILCSAALTFIPLFWSLTTELLSASTAAAAVGMINAIASLGGLGGPGLFGHLETRTGSFSLGQVVMSLCAFAAGLLILLAPRAQPQHEG